MHDGNLGNCDNSQCIADERPTGHGNAALFCCCNTHYCNRRVQFPPQRKATRKLIFYEFYEYVTCISQLTLKKLVYS